MFNYSKSSLLLLSSSALLSLRTVPRLAWGPSAQSYDLLKTRATTKRRGTWLSFFSSLARSLSSETPIAAPFRVLRWRCFVQLFRSTQDQVPTHLQGPNFNGSWVILHILPSRSYECWLNPYIKDFIHHHVNSFYTWLPTDVPTRTRYFLVHEWRVLEETRLIIPRLLHPFSTRKSTSKSGPKKGQLIALEEAHKEFL